MRRRKKRVAKRHRLKKGYGSVYEIKNKNKYGEYYYREKPWVFRYKGKYIGYYETEEEAVFAALEYHRQSHIDLDKPLTFKEVFKLWLEHDSNSIVEKTVNEYKRKFNSYCLPLHEKIYRDLTAKDFIEIMDNQDVKNGTKNNILKLLKAMDRCAYKFGVIEKKATDLIPYYKKDPPAPKKPFTESEIKTLWEHQDDQDIDLILILLYSGMRSGELAELKVANIHLDENYMIGGFKTKAGTDRYIPIHPKIKKLIKNRIEESKRVTLLNYSAKQFRSRFKRALTKLDMDHTPHECRHTFITRLDNAGANRVSINMIVGHAGNGVGEQIYTHKTVEQLQETVNLLS